MMLFCHPFSLRSIEILECVLKKVPKYFLNMRFDINFAAQVARQLRPWG